MHRTHRYITSLFPATALATPLVTIASPRPQDDRDSRKLQRFQRYHRVYDAKHGQYHNWDDNENQLGTDIYQKITKRITLSPRQAKGTARILGLAS